MRSGRAAALLAGRLPRRFLMSLRSKLSFVSILGASAFVALGCSGRGTASSTTDSTAEALDEANGGLQPMAKEGPAFDDSKVLALAPMDATLADPGDMTVDAAAVTGATSYHVLLVWGHLPSPADDEDTD